ncbi:MAG: glycoside hydrolase family 3 C-terminal domain-containing protein [Chromatiales bacterium]|nr:glycoside hydrolase family 3 C-terminal domain-containing protein [Chromatiales bacterium]
MQPKPAASPTVSLLEQRVAELLSRMTLAEKVGQMAQRDGSHGYPPDYLGADIRAGRCGAVINVVDASAVNELQRIARQESRLGIPLLVGRDVIHGFRTILPIPLGQAATWNPGLVRAGARMAAEEAAAAGVNWTFAPMLDITRDPRWGRIAESLGEDPYLASRLGEAMIRGFQGKELAEPDALAACAKHIAGYGAVEGGRDYAATSIPEIDLRNVYLPPFQAAVRCGVATMMPSFSELNGVPATANRFLLTQVLREEWGFDGVVVSDWDSVCQLCVHGTAGDKAHAALLAVTAGTDMEMTGDAYNEHLGELVALGTLDPCTVDEAVARILRLKFRLGLFDARRSPAKGLPARPSRAAIETARLAAEQSVVLLKNNGPVLPLSIEQLDTVAVIGPLADAPWEQLGTWVFDGDPGETVTPLCAIESLAGGHLKVRHVPAMVHSRGRAGPGFDEAVETARNSDVVLLFLGEEAILSGEAHCRADIGLPGDQLELVRQLHSAGKPVVAVIMAGRPLALTQVLDHVDAVLFAWHPGTMGGQAIAELLFGLRCPSGKLPVTFPRMVGQVPIYYSQKNTGKPPSPAEVVHIDDIDPQAAQTSLGMVSFHLDAGYRPLFPFGFGLSYTQFHYGDIFVRPLEVSPGERITIGAEVTNAGAVAGEEVVQLYVRDVVGSVTRPVRELKGFLRVQLEPGEKRRVEFALDTDALAFHGADLRWAAEPGEFRAWIGGDSDAELGVNFRLSGTPAMAGVTS